MVMATRCRASRSGAGNRGNPHCGGSAVQQRRRAKLASDRDHRPAVLPDGTISAMSEIIHCIYASKAAAGFSEAQLPQLLQNARANNAAAGLTGMLLYVDGNFFQVLEGEPASVARIFARICSDARHERVTQIIREPIFERQFAEWTMGYARIGLGEAKAHIGENDFFTSATCLENLSPGRARKLLSAFRQGRWRADHTGMHRAGVRVA